MKRAMYAVEHDIPLPPKRSRAGKYPFWLMKVGDSFFVPTTERIHIQRIAASMSMESKRHGGKYTLRVIEDGVRVWRIK